MESLMQEMILMMIVIMTMDMMKVMANFAVSGWSESAILCPVSHS